MLLLIAIICATLVFVLCAYLYFKRDPYKHLPVFTIEDLQKYDGTKGPIYIGAGSLVFDVTSCEAYRPGNNYSVFAGKDATVALARMSLSSTDMNIEAHLTPQEKTTLQEWLDFYIKRKNYPVVGRLTRKTKTS